MLSYQGALVKAVGIKLSDPQGFINPNGTILFFDIHTGSASGAQKLLDEVKARLNQLPRSLADGLGELPQISLVELELSLNSG